MDPHDANFLLVGLRPHDLGDHPEPAQTHSSLALDQHVVGRTRPAHILDVPDDAVQLLGYLDVRFPVNREHVDAGLLLPRVVADLLQELVGAVERQAGAALAELERGLVPLLRIGGVAKAQVLVHAAVLLVHVLPRVGIGFLRLRQCVLSH